MLPHRPTRRACLGLLSGLPLLGLARPAWAASPEVFAMDGLAIGGTDPVAYFEQNAPVPGVSDFALMWRGATWVFASADSMEAFEMNPDAYAPQFGGYCAYALAQGSLAASVPEAWTIYQHRLYLNYSVAVRQHWQADIPGYLAQASAYWPAILRS